MKKIIHALLIGMLFTSFISCEKNGVEVVSQDTSYQLDATYISVDIPRKFDFNPANIIYLAGQTNIVIDAVNNGENTTIGNGTEFEFSVNLKKPLSHDVTVKLVMDKDLLADYTEPHVDFKDFPEDTYSLSQATIKAGEKRGVITMKLTNIDKLNELPGYLMPLRLDVQPLSEDVKISAVLFRVFVKLNITFTNIDSSGNVVEGTEFNSDAEVAFSSNYGTVDFLNDGLTNNPWYNSNASTWLMAAFTSEETVKGIKIQTNDDQYKFKGVTIFTEENGEFVKQGVFSKEEPVGNGVKTFYIGFNKPVSTKRIRFESFLTQSNSPRYADITEMSFIR